ncbi:hypothetical protein [Halopelagius longus]|uniref:Uncharacterized protein n=1 Tax=Halopelagius longus TaxID=1236180 RepID=A0A1H1FFV6_9EURY|nr:hypothetical protein [Halopelagius longus]RDI70120.1 hypothetical protein DWB78_15970 [Halopelagius longus]SDQ99825.1 hypothetical protein SAMN05216278_3191 [Halopelagius longus]
MNKLRAFVVCGSVALAVGTLWAAFRYGVAPASRTGYLRAVAAAVLLPAIPVALARAKLWIRRLAEYRRNGSSLSFERKSIFVSGDEVGDADGTLEDIEAAVAAADEYDECRRDRFGEGRGLTVRHTGFHNSFVRIAGDGRVVVTGASENTHSLASLVERVVSLPMERTRNHPLLEPKPVRGAPRAFLGLFLVALFLFGVGGVGAAAYPADAYSAPERAVFVGYDARADALPGYDETDATVDKAALLVKALGEEAVELQWDRDDATRLSEHTRQSVFLSARGAEMLDDARAGNLDAADRKRVSALETDLHAAECRVASAITTRIEKGRVEGDAEALRDARRTLRERASAAGHACTA